MDFFAGSPIGDPTAFEAQRLLPMGDLLAQPKTFNPYVPCFQDRRGQSERPAVPLRSGLFDGTASYSVLTTIVPPASGFINCSFIYRNVSNYIIGTNSLGLLITGGYIGGNVGSQTYTTIKGTTVLVSGTAYTARLEWTGTVVTLKLNGVTEYTGAQVGIVTSIYTLAIGCNNNAGTFGGFYYGEIWDVNINNIWSSPGPSNNTTQAIWFDTSGNGRHAVATVPSVAAHCADGYVGGSDAFNQSGYSIRTGTYNALTLASCMVPAKLLNDGLDAVEVALQYPGRAKYSIYPKSAPCAYFSGTINDRVLTAIMPSAEGFIGCSFIYRGAGVLIGAASAIHLYCFIDIFGGKLTGGIGTQLQGTIAGTTILVSGTAYTARLEWTGATVTLKLNGVTEYTGAQVGAVPTTVPFMIGAYNNNGTPGVPHTGEIFNVNINGTVFPLMEKDGSTVYGYQQDGTVVTGTVTAASLPIFWGSTANNSYFHGLQYGYTDNAGVMIGGNPYNLGKDLQGNALQFRAGYANASASYQVGAFPEIITSLGLSSTWFNGSGVPNTVTYANEIIAGHGPKFYFGTKGAAIYSVAQTGATDLKIKSILGA